MCFLLLPTGTVEEHLENDFSNPSAICRFSVNNTAEQQNHHIFFYTKQSITKGMFQAA